MLPGALEKTTEHSRGIASQSAMRRQTDGPVSQGSDAADQPTASLPMSVLYPNIFRHALLEHFVLFASYAADHRRAAVHDVAINARQPVVEVTLTSAGNSPMIPRT
jgi:hypothetical protein